MKNKSSAAERIAAMRREEEAASKVSSTEPDFTEIAKKLEERQAAEKKGENEGYTKMTIYIRDDILAGFNALITKRGQQKEFANQAISDFVLKKIKELGI